MRTTAEDRFLEVFQQGLEDDLNKRRKVERRVEYQERYKQRKGGHAGELTTMLEVPRRYWPAVHEAAITNSIPIRTERLPRGAVTPLQIITTESGALRLRVALQALEEPEQ